MKLTIKAGATSNIFQIFVRDSSSTTGAGLTGLVFNSASLTAYYHKDTDTTATAITLVTMTVGTFTSSGFKEIDATNMPGWYQFCPPDAAVSSGKSCAFHLKGATNMAPLPIEVMLVAVDFQDTVRLGLTALPNVASGSSGAIPTTGTGSNQISVSSGQVILQTGTGTGQLDFTSGVVKANATQILGTAVSTPATAGILDVNVKNMNNVAGTSITTVNANIGTTQPVNFTGTGASALAKSDVVDIAGAAVSTTTAQLGVNVVSINAVAASSVTAVNANVGTTQPLNFTGTGASALVKSDMVDVAGAAVSTTTAQIGVNTVQLNGQTVTAGAGVTFPSSVASPTNITAGTITTATNLTNAPTSGDFTAVMKTSLNAATPTASLSTLDSLVLHSGTAQAGGSTSITLASGASATDNLYRGLEVTVYGGTGAAQTRVITAYVGSTKVATVDEAWITNPDSSSTYKVTEIRTPKMDTSQQVVAASVQGNVTGSVASVTGNVGGNVVGSVASVTARVTANTDQLAGQTVTAGAGVTFPTSVASPTNITAGTITTVTNLTNAPTSGDFTATMKTSLNAATPAVTVSDKTGFSLSAAGVQAIWDALTSALTTVGSIGKLLAALPGSVWDVVLASHLTAGSTGAGLNSASSAGDPWGTAIPGAYGAGSAGFIVGTNVNATISSRLASASYTAPDNTTITTINTKIGTPASSVSADIAAVQADTDNIQTRIPAALVSGRMDSSEGAIQVGVDFSAVMKTSLNAATPAATLSASERNAIADATLKRDWTAITGEASRSMLNALRFLRNKWSLSGSTLTVTTENDSTTAWTATVTTDAAAEPVTGSDPT